MPRNTAARTRKSITSLRLAEMLRDLAELRSDGTYSEEKKDLEALAQLLEKGGSITASEVLVLISTPRIG